MATYNTATVVKNLRHRGPHDGKDFNVSGSLVISPGQSYALVDVLNMVILGENQRPVRLVLSADTLSGTPVLTNPTFNIGVAPATSGSFTRADGTVYPVTPADVDILSAAAVIDGDKMFTDIEVARPVLDGVPLYAPYYVTLQPAGAGAFSVAGGTVQLKLEVITQGESRPNALVYSEWINQKVKN